MEPELPEPTPEPDYRHLPPRVTPDEMVETKPVLRLYEDWPAGTEDERALRTSAG